MLGGRDKTQPKRLRQARAVKEIVTERFGEEAGEYPFAILGDFNDYLEEDEQGTTGIAELVGWEELENVVERLPEEEGWTHFWPRGKAYRQLDYLLLSRSLAEANSGGPEIMRRTTATRRALRGRALHRRRARQPESFRPMPGGHGAGGGGVGLS